MLIRDGDRGGRGRKSEGSTTDTTPKRPERPWAATRTMEVLRRCFLAIAQQLVHCAIAVSTAVPGQSHINVHCTAVEELEAKEVKLSQPSSTSLLISSGLTWRSSSTSLLLSSDLAWNLVLGLVNFFFWHMPWATSSIFCVLPPHQHLLLTPALSYP